MTTAVLRLALGLAKTPANMEAANLGVQGSYAGADFTVLSPVFDFTIAVLLSLIEVNLAVRLRIFCACLFKFIIQGYRVMYWSS
jgi:hypothetical protein